MTVVAERDDVDLLATQLVHDHADTGAACADTGTHRVDVRVVGRHGDLRALTRLASAGLDLDDTVGDLGHLELEQAADQARMRPRHHDLGSLHRPTHLDDVGLHALAGLGALVVHLLGLGKESLDPTEIEQRVAGIGLLDDARDDVALAVGVLLVLEVPLHLADALGHDVPNGLRGDPTEVVGGDIELRPGGQVVLIELLGEDTHLTGLGVDVHPHELVVVVLLLVGSLQRLGERREESILGDPATLREGVERLHHLWVHCVASVSSVEWFCIFWVG